MTRMNVTGDVTIAATSTKAEAKADARGGSGSVGIAVTLFSAEATVSGSTSAYLGRLGSAAAATPAQFFAGGLAIEAKAVESTATATLLSVAVGLVGGGIGTNPSKSIPAKAVVSGLVEATAGPIDPAKPAAERVALNLGAHGLVILAEAFGVATADARGGAGSLLIAVAILGAESTTSLGTSASLAADTTVFGGKVDVSAITKSAKAESDVVVGQGAVLAGGGKAEAKATSSGGAAASIGDRATVRVTDGFVRVAAETTALANADALIATGNGIAGGRETVGQSPRPPSGPATWSSARSPGARATPRRSPTAGPSSPTAAVGSRR
jgi:hypothetical protein